MKKTKKALNMLWYNVPWGREKERERKLDDTNKQTNKQNLFFLVEIRARSGRGCAGVGERRELKCGWRVACTAGV